MDGKRTKQSRRDKQRGRYSRDPSSNGVAFATKLGDDIRNNLQTAFVLRAAVSRHKEDHMLDDYAASRKVLSPVEYARVVRNSKHVIDMISLVTSIIRRTVNTPAMSIDGLVSDVMTSIVLYGVCFIFQNGDNILCDTGRFLDALEVDESGQVRITEAVLRAQKDKSSECRLPSKYSLVQPAFLYRDKPACGVTVYPDILSLDLYASNELSRDTHNSRMACLVHSNTADMILSKGVPSSMMPDVPGMTHAQIMQTQTLVDTVTKSVCAAIGQSSAGDGTFEDLRKNGRSLAYSFLQSPPTHTVTTVPALPSDNSVTQTIEALGHKIDEKLGVKPIQKNRMVKENQTLVSINVSACTQNCMQYCEQTLKCIQYAISQLLPRAAFEWDEARLKESVAELYRPILDSIRHGGHAGETAHD